MFQHLNVEQLPWFTGVLIDWGGANRKSSLNWWFSPQFCLFSYNMGKLLLNLLYGPIYHYNTLKCDNFWWIIFGWLHRSRLHWWVKYFLSQILINSMFTWLTWVQYFNIVSENILYCKHLRQKSSQNQSCRHLPERDDKTVSVWSAEKVAF